MRILDELIDAFEGVLVADKILTFKVLAILILHEVKIALDEVQG